MDTNASETRQSNSVRWEKREERSVLRSIGASSYRMCNGKGHYPCISPSTHDISPQRKHHWRVSGIESLLIGRIVMQSFAAEMHIDQHFTSNPMSQPNSGVNPTNVHLYFAYNLFNRRAIKATKAPNLLIKPSIELASQGHDNKDRKSRPTTWRQQNFILLLYSYIAF